jgi:CheY-like chemotaxis protein
VFERFRQAEGITTRTHGGLGLGLAIAKQLVELHGGRISAESEGEGRGAVFTVRLPLQRGSITDEETVKTVRERAGSLDGVSVLLVEDDPCTREATRRLLEIDGADVRVAGTAAEAREAYVADAPDLIVCDIGLPTEDGLTLIRRLRQLEHGSKRRRVPAVAVTAFARVDDQRRALAAGFDKHIPKPVDSDNLLAAMTELLHAPETRKH